MANAPRKKLSLRHGGKQEQALETPSAPPSPPSDSVGPHCHPSHDPALVSDDEIPW
jgi:hypothetical protein